MNLSYEKKAWGRGHGFIAGLDEAGRGPLAGPVTAAAVAIRPGEESGFKLREEFKKIDDSKKLSAKKREKLYEFLTNHPQILWEISWVTPKLIDRINIFEATKKAMKRATKRLEEKAGERSHLLFLDGNFKIGMRRKQKAVKGGDGKVFLCACASILAKVFRDRTMVRYSRFFPEYGFEKHKGYPTKLHKKKIRIYGPCRIHRKSFKLL